MSKPKITMWVTADWHFNHYNIIKYCDRPFDNVEDMNNAIIDNHNALVKPHDIVYVLGDIGTKDLDLIIPQLNGVKILIRGNHDRDSLAKYLQAGFTAVLDHAEIMVGKKRIHMRHTPTRSPKEFLYLCKIWASDMRKKGRSWKVIWDRIRREYKSFRRRTTQTVLCGHVHNNWKHRHNNVNVGVDVRDFKPVKLYNAADEYKGATK